MKQSKSWQRHGPIKVLSLFSPEPIQVTELAFDKDEKAFFRPRVMVRPIVLMRFYEGPIEKHFCERKVCFL